MTAQQIQRLAPAFWIGGGVMFFLAAWLGKQLAFAGVGAMFIALGVVFGALARKNDKATGTDEP